MFKLKTYKQIFENKDSYWKDIPLPEIYPSVNHSTIWIDAHRNDIINKNIRINTHSPSDYVEELIIDLYESDGRIYLVSKDYTVYQLKYHIKVHTEGRRIFSKIDPYGEEVWEKINWNIFKRKKNDRDWFEFIKIKDLKNFPKIEYLFAKTEKEKCIIISNFFNENFIGKKIQFDGYNNNRRVRRRFIITLTGVKFDCTRDWTYTQQKDPLYLLSIYEGKKLYFASPVSLFLASVYSKTNRRFTREDPYGEEEWGINESKNSKGDIVVVRDDIRLFDIHLNRGDRYEIIGFVDSLLMKGVYIQLKEVDVHYPGNPPTVSKGKYIGCFPEYWFETTSDHKRRKDLELRMKDIDPYNEEIWESNNKNIIKEELKKYRIKFGNVEEGKIVVDKLIELGFDIYSKKSYLEDPNLFFKKKLERRDDDIWPCMGYDRAAHHFVQCGENWNDNYLITLPFSDFMSVTSGKKYKRLENPIDDPYGEEDWGMGIVEEGIKNFASTALLLLALFNNIGSDNRKKQFDYDYFLKYAKTMNVANSNPIVQMAIKDLKNKISTDPKIINKQDVYRVIDETPIVYIKNDNISYILYQDAKKTNHGVTPKCWCSTIFKAGQKNKKGGKSMIFIATNASYSDILHEYYHAIETVVDVDPKILELFNFNYSFKQQQFLFNCLTGWEYNLKKPSEANVVKYLNNPSEVFSRLNNLKMFLFKNKFLRTPNEDISEMLMLQLISGKVYLSLSEKAKEDFRTSDFIEILVFINVNKSQKIKQYVNNISKNNNLA